MTDQGEGGDGGSLLDRIAAAHEEELRELWALEIAHRNPALRFDQLCSLRDLLRDIRDNLRGEAKDDALPALMQLASALRPADAFATVVGDKDDGRRALVGSPLTLSAASPTARTVDPLPFAGSDGRPAHVTLEPHPQMGMTAPTSPKKRPAQALPFARSGGAATNVVKTLEAYAALTAQLAAYPASRAHVLRSFEGGLTEKEFAAAEQHWRAAIDADPQVHHRFHRLVAHYRQHYDNKGPSRNS